MRNPMREHPDEDTLEKYLLGSLDEKEAQGVEEHLLVCQPCIDKAEDMRNYIQAMRKAAGTGEPKVKAAGGGKPN